MTPARARARRVPAGADARPGATPPTASWIIDKGKTRRLDAGLPRRACPARGSSCSRPRTTTTSPSAEAASIDRRGRVLGRRLQRVVRAESSTSVLRCSSSLPGPAPDRSNFGDRGAFDRRALDAHLRAARRSAAASSAHQRVGVDPGLLDRAVPLRGDARRRPERRRPAREPPRAARRARARGVDRPLRRARANTLGHLARRREGGPPDASPGARRPLPDRHERHASARAWPGTTISRRLGYSYVDRLGRHRAATSSRSASDVRPWERRTIAPGQETFGYFDVARLRPGRVEERSTRTRRSAG